MRLRNYQTEAIAAVYDAWKNGATNVVVQLATGAGKTIIFSKIIEEYSGSSIAIAHRMELVSQVSLTLALNKIRHNIIAQKNTIREIVAIHMNEIGQSFYDPTAKRYVAGIDTLVRMDKNTPWFNQVGLCIQDEGHHPLKNNKWGRAASFFPNAKGLYPTATPTRADGRGLGRDSDGIMDALVVGISMRELINQNYLTDYRIFAPPNDLDLSTVPLSASGDYSPPKLRNAVHKSRITGNVVSHYLKIAPNKSGVTFAVDIETATEIAKEFRDNGVSAEVISSKTPDLLRNSIMRRFRCREILQIVNVDLLGEGVDVPAIEVVSMARPTQSYGLYSQQFGRALRPMPGKTHAIIIDHVNNVIRHGLPDAPREWTLDRREKRSRGKDEFVIPLKVCLNISCVAVYPATCRVCPHCGFYPVPTSRSAPEFVDGDLCELDPEVLAKLRGEINRIDGAPTVPQYLTPIAQRGVMNRHKERQELQNVLRETISQWAGYLKFKGNDDSVIYRTFYFKFGIDIANAQTLGGSECNDLCQRLKKDIDIMNNTL